MSATPGDYELGLVQEQFRTAVAPVLYGGGWDVLAAIGIVLLANPGGTQSVDTLGLIFVLIAGACWAAYILIAQRAGHRSERG